MSETCSEDEARQKIAKMMDQDANELFYRSQSGVIDEHSISLAIWLLLCLYREYRRNPATITESTTAQISGNSAHGIGFPYCSQEDMVAAIRSNIDAQDKANAGRYVTHKDLWNIYNHLIVITVGIMTLFLAIFIAVNGWLLNLKQEQPASEPSQTFQGSPSSGESGGYNGSRTRSHSPASTSPKRGDKSPTRPASR